MRPEFTDPYAAARVSSFMDEGALGRWQVTRFTVDDLKARRSMARHIADSHSSEEAEMRLARNVPPGDYVSLRRRAVPEELPDVEQEVVYEDGSAFDGWVPIMSDTPSEIHEHDEAIENAHGRVLITGLGLGVLVSALLAKPEVEHITVVEIDRDVIGLTGHYYSNHPKVRLVNADALAFARDILADGRLLSRNVSYDYAWHDIWSHISERNLDDSLAEHGISYGMMFAAFAPIAKAQGAWAIEHAKRKGEIEEIRTRRRLEFIDLWRTGTAEQKIEALIDGVVRDNLGSLVAADDPIPDEVRDFFIERMDLREFAERVVTEAGLDIDKLERDLKEPEPPLARPNTAEEANIARF
jgi:hypothetical protein